MTVTLFFLANLLYCVAYVARDILWLRVLTIVAASCTFPYFIFRDETLYSALFWQATFAVINALNVGRLLWERRPVAMTDEERRRGLLTASVNGEFMRHVRDGEFVGELSYILGHETTAEVAAVETTRYLTWDRAVLDAHLEKDQGVKTKFENLIGVDVAAKLAWPKGKNPLA